MKLEIGNWKFIKTHDAKKPRAVLGKDRSTGTPRSHRSDLCELGGKREEVYIVKDCPLCEIFTHLLGFESLSSSFFGTEPQCNIRPPAAALKHSMHEGMGDAFQPLAETVRHQSRPHAAIAMPP